MRHALAVVVLLFVGFVAGEVLAQKAVTFTSSGTVITEVQLSRTQDGGFAITVIGENTPAGSDVTLSRTHTCEVSSLTAAQKTALSTVRAGALACWNSKESL